MTRIFGLSAACAASAVVARRTDASRYRVFFIVIFLMLTLRC